MRTVGSGEAAQHSRHISRSRRFRPASLLVASLCGALVAALVTLPAGVDDPLAAPDSWTDGTTLSWTPVSNTTSYVVVADAGGRTAERVVACCSAPAPAADSTATTYYVRTDKPGSKWSRAGKRPKRKTTTRRPTRTTAPATTAPAGPVGNGPSPTTTTATAATTTTTAPTTTATTTAPTVAPTTVAPSIPAGTATATAVCDKIPALYPTAPAGAIVVDPAVVGDLDKKTQAAPAGSTFWLKPGTHTLGTGQFAQVQPKDGDTFLGAPGAVLDGRGKNAYAFTQQARNVTISNLTVQGFVAPRDEGVVNHDSGDGWTIQNSTIQNNGGAGLMAGAHQKVVGNCLRNNGQYAMNAYKQGDSIVGLLVQGNEIVGNNTDDWESKVSGCGCTGGIKFWAVNGADVRGNWVHANHGPGLWADTNNNDFLVENNLFESNEGEGLFYEVSYNLILRDNTFRKNALVSGKEFADRGDNFPEAAVYLSESGGEPRIPARTAKIDISGNTFDNNWSGITAWENADRFCNSPANSSSGDCTRLVPKISTCAAPGIAKAPLLDTCRWKTQNVDIHGNTFSFDPQVIGCTNGMCGRMAVLSNYGTFPSWSPYRGTVVQNAITFKQNDVWRSNSYSGPWKFMPFDTAHTLTAAQWQAAPYGQDACSSFTGGAATC
jgi:Right handed beta helix region